MNDILSAKITGLYRYPVKGLSGQPLDTVAIAPGECIAFDRAYAIENGARDFDPARPRHMPKNKFLMLMSHERLAALDTRFDDQTRELIIERDGKPVARGQLDQKIGRQLIEQFIAAYMSEELRGAPRIVTASGHAFTDIEPRWLSFINLASVRDLERVSGQPVDPLRFRANIYVDGLEPWQEFDHVGSRMTGPDGTILKVEERITRCAAINVDPASGARDASFTRTLMSAFGHMDMGLYVSVAAGGTLRVGDDIALGS